MFIRVAGYLPTRSGDDPIIKRKGKAMKCLLRILVLSVLLVWINLSFAQHTFSIVAIDTVNGQVGSAAASFVGGCTQELISQVFYISPGVGVIHTQAGFMPQNAFTAQNLMRDGKSPQEIVDYLVANDATGVPQDRQYIVIDLIDGGRVAGYTGSENPSYCNHILGKTYAIAGNILYDKVLEEMESGFLNTSGELSDKLMAALMGGKSAGGDMRGKEYHLSSLVAELKVADPRDTDILFLDLLVAYDPIFPGIEIPATDPVDSLKSLYNEWKGIINNVDDFQKKDYDYCLYQNYPNPFNPSTSILYTLSEKSYVSMKIHDMLGREIRTLFAGDQTAGSHKVEWDGLDDRGGRVPSGIYFYTLTAKGFRETRKLLMLR